MLECFFHKRARQPGEEVLCMCQIITKFEYRGSFFPAQTIASIGLAEFTMLTLFCHVRLLRTLLILITISISYYTCVSLSVASAMYLIKPLQFTLTLLQYSLFL